jgi:hypothetical protein
LANFGAEIEHLPADYAAEPGGAGKRDYEFHAHGRIGMGLLARQHVEGEG